MKAFAGYAIATEMRLLKFIIVIVVMVFPFRRIVIDMVGYDPTSDYKYPEIPPGASVSFREASLNAYQNCLMCFSTARGSIAIDSDTISLCQSSFPDTINICIKANAISRVLSKSDDIIIKEPGIYRIETKGIFLQKRPVNYIELDRRKFKILSKDSIQDVFSTNATLKRNTSDRNLDGTRNLTVTEKEEECSNGLIEPKG
jgi:hypothetical protein